MRKHPQIIAIISILKESGEITWNELKEKAMPSIYARPNELTRTLVKLEKEGRVELSQKQYTSRSKIIVGIKYCGDRGMIRATAVKNDEEMMPCKARVSKCYHVGCYLAELCKIRPEYIYQMEEVE